MIKCNVNCIESMGLKDGPGIRTVIFLQECNLRCNYCHNPEMWLNETKTEYTVEELMGIIRKYKPYYSNNGGITLSGGEPLLQTEFITMLFKACKEEGIHTCLDTAGVGTGDYQELLKYTDLILFDVKHTTSEGYKSLVHYDMEKSLEFIKVCNKATTKIWIRQVIIPGVNDNVQYIKSLKNFIKDINNIEKVELLPYHTLGSEKYKNLGIPYVLENTDALSEDVYNVLINELNNN